MNALTRQVSEVRKLFKKKNQKKSKLEKNKNETLNCRQVQASRHEALAYVDGSTAQDREFQAAKRQLKTLREALPDLEDEFQGVSNAYENRSKALHQNLSPELEIKAQVEEEEYQKKNKKHLEMLKAANIYAAERLKPQRLLRDRSRRDVHSFKSHWTPEKLQEAICEDITLFRELPSLVPLLGLEEEYERAMKKREEKVNLERKQNESKAKKIRQEEQNLWDQAEKIYSGRQKMPKWLEKFGDAISMNVQVIYKLLKQHPEEEEPKKKKDNVVYDGSTRTIVDEEGDQFDKAGVQPKQAVGSYVDEPV